MTGYIAVLAAGVTLAADVEAPPDEEQGGSETDGLTLQPEPVVNFDLAAARAHADATAVTLHADTIMAETLHREINVTSPAISAVGFMGAILTDFTRNTAVASDLWVRF